MFCGSSVGELVEAGQFFLNKLQKAKITFPFLFGVLYRTIFLQLLCHNCSVCDPHFLNFRAFKRRSILMLPPYF